MPRRFWTDADIAMLRAKYADMRTADLAALLGRTEYQVYNKAYALGLGKSDAYLASPAAGRTNGRQGVGTRFKPGHKTWNAGVKGSTGLHENTRRTQFKKGSAPHNTKQIGDYRINADGYLDKKISNEKGGNHVRWHPVHRLVWEQAHGPVPVGHVVVFKPGMKTTELDKITIDVVELVSRGELMRRNTIHRYPPELRSTIKLVAKLKRKIEAAHEKQD